MFWALTNIVYEKTLQRCCNLIVEIHTQCAYTNIVDTEALRHSPIGQLVPIQGNDARHGPYACFAYLPAPLPDSLPPLQMATISAVAEATGALSRLDQACAQLNEPGLLIRPALYREALDTSALEGTYGQLAEVLEAELPSFQFRSAEVREILGYVSAAEYAFVAIRERPISINLLSVAQDKMLGGLDNPPPDVGMVRQRQVWIGPKYGSINDARFIPAPGDDRLKSAVETWIEWLDSDNDWPVVLRAAIAHYQFETLHPFSDGNGRIGRLAIILQLLQSDAIKYPAVTISPWLVRHRDQYQQELFRVSCTGEWDAWIQLVCSALIEQCKALVAGTERLVRWLNGMRAEVNKRRWTGGIYHVLDDLTQKPLITVTSVAAKYNITPTAATNVVNHLVEIGAIEELTGGTYARVFGATAVMNIVEEI